jgi:hypothetical protein
MKLSENFTLAEFTRSRTADRQGIDNTPPLDVVYNLRYFCETVMQPIRDSIKRKIRLSSGFRCFELNTLLKSRKTSYHPRGLAGDAGAEGLTAFEFAVAISEMDIPYDKVILEFDRWVHIQGKPEGETPRRKLLTAVKVKGKTEYLTGLWHRVA